MPPPPPMKLPLVSKPSPSPSSSTSTSTRWLAIQTRDPRFTNTFVYAVLTTKIYCRPTCPARLARRANVRFYDTASQAERAGFRACKRCKPEKTIINNINKNSNTLEEDKTGGGGGGGGGTFSTAFHPQIQSVQRACQTIRASVRAGSKPTLRELAAEAGLTTSHFHRVFKRIVGVTVGRYVSDVMRGMGCDGDEDGENKCGDRDGLDGNGDGNGPVLWNDFDVLLAAEEGFFAMQDVQPGVVVQDEELLAWRAVGSFGVGGGYSVDETLQALDTTTNDAL
ncbi:hypothetical protein ASPBRDRAFT_46889 [Aspergillus brasiliensis CBS 101740]|uniref:HTH araC/xylS-type domain-containing protein n=1 Tax=Aspergillus brasiliensis (strain CBS 101740 / IMI 381727 / IBT 21946) TaxID=767769 RepID=A0A1L9UAH3_ASPBC|nr:hypothetical protein ASPBRDRAFT_46889 [Aspergillus brasiliensis CBS 101740]